MPSASDKKINLVNTDKQLSIKFYFFKMRRIVAVSINEYRPDFPRFISVSGAAFCRIDIDCLL